MLFKRKWSKLRKLRKFWQKLRCSKKIKVTRRKQLKIKKRSLRKQKSPCLRLLHKINNHQQMEKRREHRTTLSSRLNLSSLLHYPSRLKR